MSGNTVQLHRVIRAPAERIYRAFLDPLALAKWLPPYGFTATIDALQAEVGGRFRIAFENFSNQQRHSFSGEYLELVPHELIRYTDQFDDPNLPGILTVTVRLRPVLCGTELQVTQENIPAVIPVEMCYLGWQESLVQLAQLVEPTIPT